jgi:hypothetical protein
MKRWKSCGGTWVTGPHGKAARESRRLVDSRQSIAGREELAR